MSAMGYVPSDPAHHIGNGDVAATLHVPLTQDEHDNLTRAALDLDLSTHEVLAMLAGRVQVESASRVYLSGGGDGDDGSVGGGV